MKISTYAAYTHALPVQFKGKTAIVIDLLRATSTMTAALQNGAKRVIPVEEIADALALAASLGKKMPVLCGGERDGAKLDGFDLGNSPLEYGREVVQGKHIVLCTTNGTQAVAKAAKAEAVYMGCLNNARAVAQKAALLGRDIVILCAGTRKLFSLDDVVCAGAIISRIMQTADVEEMDDLSCMAGGLYENNRSDLHALLSSSRPYRTLMRLERKEDIAVCLTEDTTLVVPEYADGEVRIQANPAKPRQRKMKNE